MNICSIKNLALGIALTATAFAAQAQKVYNEGSIVYNITVMGNSVDAKSYFKADTSSLTTSRGPAEIKMIGTASSDYFAIIVTVPVANMKKAAVATPSEIEEVTSNEAQYTFTKTAETKKISDFNCVKYDAKEAKGGKVYELWITNDIKIPANMLTKYYSKLPGTPVMFTYLQGGSEKGAQVVTLKSINGDKIPANSFKIPADYDKISLTDMQSMGRGKQ